MRYVTAITASVLVFALLSGCGETPVPRATDFNGNSVTIGVDTFSDQKQAEVLSLAEANRICRTVGKIAEFSTVVQGANESNYILNRLYICK